MAVPGADAAGEQGWRRSGTGSPTSGTTSAPTAAAIPLLPPNSGYPDTTPSPPGQAGTVQIVGGLAEAGLSPHCPAAGLLTRIYGRPAGREGGNGVPPHQLLADEVTGQHQGAGGLHSADRGAHCGVRLVERHL